MACSTLSQVHSSNTTARNLHNFKPETLPADRALAAPNPNSRSPHKFDTKLSKLKPASTASVAASTICAPRPDQNQSTRNRTILPASAEDFRSAAAIQSPESQIWSNRSHLRLWQRS
ncbi:hypothetical protein FF1_040152 [Malus domestica]